MELKNHTEILNYLIERYNLNSYLEIGVQNKINFNAIKLDNHQKVSVDPDPQYKADFIGTSDEYFQKIHDVEFGVIFIDGDHTEEQCEKDFVNALSILSPGGFIVLHDTVPELEERTRIPRETKQWNGSVYKFACTLCKFDRIEFKTFRVDHGVTVVWKTPTKKYNNFTSPITWEFYLENREFLLRYNNELPRR